MTAMIHHFAVQDRSAEFRSCVASLSKINRQQQHKQYQPQVRPSPVKSEFAHRAGQISHDISHTTAMLTRLGALARRKTLFDDRPVEIAELTFVIKQKVSSINQSIAALLKQVKEGSGLGITSNQSKQQTQQLSEHANNVVVMLQGKLTIVTTTFEQVLEIRLKNIQASRDRTDQFISSSSANVVPPAAQNNYHSPQQQQAQASVVKTGGAAVASGIDRESPLYSVQRSRGPTQQQQQHQHPSSTPSPGASANPYASHHHDYPDDHLTLPSEQQQSMLLLEEQNPDFVYQSQRGTAVTAIESTIQELGGIFTQLASMVAEQRDVIQRIDYDTEDISLNVVGAQRQLLKYYARVTSNRWLYIRLFAVLIFFFMIWVIVS